MDFFNLLDEDILDLLRNNYARSKRGDAIDNGNCSYRRDKLTKARAVIVM